MEEAPPAPGSVLVVSTCLADAWRPEVTTAVFQVLERLGISARAAEAVACCGQPAYNAGAWADARAMARHLVRSLGATAEPVVVPSGSCADMIRHHVPHLLEEDPELHEVAVRVAGRTFEFTQFLTEVVHRSSLPCTFARRVAYHPSCHLLRGMGVDQGPRALLRGAEGASPVPLRDEDQCCGFGGLFSLKMAGISGAMLARKLDAIEASGAEAVVSCDLGCLLQIEGGLRRRGLAVEARHIAEVLATP
ncbi:MAG TPA: (Fe-S)-binding protein [Vicinamibacteria bacterium]|nr:(Fe-S)-binding protein [Vicinamibacteria bacterium]